MIAQSHVDVFEVPPQSLPKLVEFQKILCSFNNTINLVSKTDIQHIWKRHIVDSAQIYSVARKNILTWLDIGSGGGLPGLVLACIFDAVRPEITVNLVESDQRKATFLREASRLLELSTVVVCGEIQEIPAINCDVISARAVAPLAKLLSMSENHLSPNVDCIFLKGSCAVAEIASARNEWFFDMSIKQSRTSPDSSILHLSNVRRV